MTRQEYEAKKARLNAAVTATTNRYIAAKTETAEILAEKAMERAHVDLNTFLRETPYPNA